MRDETWDPRVGPRMAVGWLAIHRHLAGHETDTWVALKEVARKGSDLKGKTCRNLIGDARRHGFLEIVLGPRGGKRYRLTEKGAAAGPEFVGRAAGDR